MIRFKIGRQTERVGIYPTLSVLVAKWVASQEIMNYHKRKVYKEYPDYKCYPLINFFLAHVIESLVPAPLIGERSARERICSPPFIILPYKMSINKEQNRDF